MREIHCCDCNNVVMKLAVGSLIGKKLAVRCSDCELILQNKEKWTSNLEASFLQQFGKEYNSPYSV